MCAQTPAPWRMVTAHRCTIGKWLPSPLWYRLHLTPYWLWLVTTLLSYTESRLSICVVYWRTRSCWILSHLERLIRWFVLDYLNLILTLYVPLVEQFYSFLDVGDFRGTLPFAGSNEANPPYAFRNIKSWSCQIRSFVRNERSKRSNSPLSLMSLSSPEIFVEIVFIMITKMKS